jgi:predicted GH43/DUF377 family glycosyl hydrolase
MWIKKGLIFNVKGEYEWNQSHAQVPIADVLTDRIRIYYATRNSAGKSNTSYIEVDKQDPSRILYKSEVPLFQFGKPGTFDDSGIMPSSILTLPDRKLLYYVGWTTRQTVPYHNAVGVAESRDGGVTFHRVSEGPVITVNHREPYFSGTSYVLAEDGKMKMWYLSCIGWEKFSDKWEPLYNIKYAESADGINWSQTGCVAVELEGDEGGLVSASVSRFEEGYRMWFGKRKKQDYRGNKSNSYRIGYAESADGIRWNRKDQWGLDVAQEGWDAEMVSYPCVVKVDSKLLMFYNGNGFGRSGLGYAVFNQ